MMEDAVRDIYEEPPAPARPARRWPVPVLLALERRPRIKAERAMLSMFSQFSTVHGEACRRRQSRP